MIRTHPFLKIFLLVLSLFILGSIQAQNSKPTKPQQHNLSLEDFIVLYRCLNDIRDYKLFPFNFDRAVYFTKAGVQKIIIKKFEAEATNDRIRKINNTPSNVDTCCYDTQGRLISINAQEKNIKIEYSDKHISRIVLYHYGRAFRAEYIVSYTDSGGFYIEYTEEYDKWGPNNIKYERKGKWVVSQSKNTMSEYTYEIGYYTHLYQKNIRPYIFNFSIIFIEEDEYSYLFDKSGIVKCAYEQNPGLVVSYYLNRNIYKKKGEIKKVVEEFWINVYPSKRKLDALNIIEYDYVY